MSGVSIDVAAVAVVTAGSPDAAGAGASVPGRPAGWWRAWRERFGLAEVCGTLAAVGGFAAGYAQTDGYPAPGVRIVRPGVITRPVRDHEKVLA